MSHLSDVQYDTAQRAAPVYHGNDLPPVIILGGEANALSVARDLGKMGVTVYLICEEEFVARHSRYCRWIPVEIQGGAEESWAGFLLGPEAEYLRGAVVLSCSDAGIQVLARHRRELLARYRLDESNPQAQVAMLDKFTTYEHAKAAGLPIPGFWEISTREQILALRESLVFPVLVKPRLSHLFQQRFGRKHMIVSSFDELLAAFDTANDARMEVLLMEWIPGGDEMLCSYFTYLDENSKPLFHFTKRVIRRFPTGMGAACHHITDWIPDLVDQANRLFSQAKLRGLANVEFKLDRRDGQYKVIECNARFTASNCLVSASGCRLAEFVYNRIVGRPAPAMKTFRQGLRLWDPIRDYWSYRELKSQGQITLRQWISGIAHRHTFAYFAWTDPKPAVVRLLKPIGRMLTRLRRPARNDGMNAPEMALGKR